jgi:hypothetical protein
VRVSSYTLLIRGINMSLVFELESVTRSGSSTRSPNSGPFFVVGLIGDRMIQTQYHSVFQFNLIAARLEFKFNLIAVFSKVNVHTIVVVAETRSSLRLVLFASAVATARVQGQPPFSVWVPCSVAVQRVIYFDNDNSI